jgi:hypothetical protein
MPIDYFKRPETLRALHEKDPEELLAMAKRFERAERDLALDLQSFDLVAGGHVHAEHAALDAKVRSHMRAYGETAYASALERVREREQKPNAAVLPAQAVRVDPKADALDGKIKRIAAREGLSYVVAFERLCGEGAL